MIYKTVALGSRFSLMQSVHESNGCFWGFAALGNLVLNGSFTNYISNRHFVFLENFPFPAKKQNNYCIVASSNSFYYLGNKIFVKRSQYMKIKNPLHKQSEKACMCFLNETC